MLAFDIETTGLSPNECSITIVCTQDFFTNEKRSYEFARVRAEGGDVDKLAAELKADFDAATSLCAFNGVRFDLPFMKQIGIERATIAEWILKTSDILEQCRLRGMPTFGLNMLCEHNKVQMKCSNGKAAIGMAERHEWSNLEVYCADDVRILCDLYRVRFLKHPRSGVLLDLKEFAHPNVYPHEAVKEPVFAQETLEVVAGEGPTTQNDTLLTILDVCKRILQHLQKPSTCSAS